MKLETLNDIFFSAVGRDLRRVMNYKRDGRWLDISSRELRQQVLSLASALTKRGVRKGDRIAILSENRPEWQITDFACLLLGVVDVPVYTTLTSEQIGYLLGDAAVRMIFVSTKEQLQKVRSIRQRTQLQETVIMDEVGNRDAPSATAFQSLIATQ